MTDNQGQRDAQVLTHAEYASNGSLGQEAIQRAALPPGQSWSLVEAGVGAGDETAGTVVGAGVCDAGVGAGVCDDGGVEAGSPQP